MMLRSAKALLAALTLLLTAPLAAEPSASPTISYIRAGRLIDTLKGAVLTDQLIRIENGRIICRD